MTDEDGSADRSVTCAWCGTVAAEGAPLEWTVQTSERGRGSEHLCSACTRMNVRSIEARLDSKWW
ncbi:MAG TPA: hypothetical protein VIJ71_07870 [Mycobacteriales bacterium]